MHALLTRISHALFYSWLGNTVERAMEGEGEFGACRQLRILFGSSQAHFFQPNHGTTACVRCQLAGEPRFLEVYLSMISKDKRFAVHPVACAATIYVPNS
jgi:hypothetical protein